MFPSRTKAIVVVAALALLGLWGALNLGRLTADPVDRIRFVIGIVFSVLILFRGTERSYPYSVAPGLLAGMTVAGALLAVCGLVIPVHQLEWLGLLLVVFAGMQWGVPEPYYWNVVPAFLMLYFAHPLPSQFLGPFTLFMQRLSITGSEWVLQGCDIPIWAHGLVMWTGQRAIEVPEACSGMRTVTTVLYSTLGMGMVLGWRWYATLVLAGVGLAQVLALNIARISLLASSSGPVGPGSTAHERSGLLLVVAIVLVVVEAALCERAFRIGQTRRGRQRSLATVLGIALAVLVATMGVWLGGSRTHAERARLVVKVAENLIPIEPAAAEEAAVAAIRLDPTVRDHHLTYAQVLLTRKKGQEALEVLDAGGGGPDTARETMLRLWALSSLGRTNEAEAVIGRMPASMRLNPLIAMTIAEMAARRNDAAETDRSLRQAATGGHSLTVRIRALFPFLAAHGLWKTIAAVDGIMPYADREPLRIAVITALKLGDHTHAATLLDEHRALWKGEPAFLDPLYVLAAQRPDGLWSRDLATLFVACQPKLSADQLTGLFDVCFALRRADLAWRAYRQLMAIDPGHPALFLVPARFAEWWFIDVAHGMQAGGTWVPALERMLPLDNGDGLGLKGKVADVVPLAKEMLDRAGLPDRRREWVRQGVAELERREESGGLSPALAGLYVDTLEQQGCLKAAHRILDTLETSRPDLRQETRFRRARLHEKQAEWGSVYEIISRLYGEGFIPTENSDLMFINALMNLDLGPGALAVARSAVNRFPGSAPLRVSLAAVWESFACHEEALLVLERGDTHTPAPLLARVLMETGHTEAANRMWSVLQMPPPLLGSRGLRPAESVFDVPAVTGAPSSKPNPMPLAGRDALEKAALLHRMACLRARAGDLAGAREALEQACGHLPGSPMLWRMRVAVSGGDPATVDRARRECPDDGDIWLAWVVCLARGSKEAQTRLDNTLETAGTSDIYPAGTLVRAGDFLLRTGHVRIAGQIARHLLQRSPDLVSVQWLGLRCALSAGDKPWARECAVNGFGLGGDEPGYLKAMTRLAMDNGLMDSELVTQLMELTRRFPREREWMERLGTAFAEAGEWPSARRILLPLFQGDRFVENPGLALLAAESCRQGGNFQEAIRILRLARIRFPANVHVLNNLAGLLAMSEETLPEAKALLPALSRLPPSASVCDTMAVIHWKGGDKAKALECADKALAGLSADTARPDYIEITLNVVEIKIAAGELQAAETIFQNANRGRQAKMALDPRAGRLQQLICERDRGKNSG